MSAKDDALESRPAGYLIWFAPPHKPETTKENILLFRQGIPEQRQHRLGVMLEIVQGDWGDPDDPSALMSQWESLLPAAELIARRWHYVELKEGKPLNRVAKRRFPSYSGAPSWIADAEILPEAGNPSFMVPTLQKLVGVFLAGLGESDPGYLHRDIRSRVRESRKMRPNARYASLRSLIEEHEHFPDSPSSGLQLWDVVEQAYRHYHPFPLGWLERFQLAPVIKRPPAFCFHAPDLWTVVIVEIAWAVEHNVEAGCCRYRDCETWFLRPRRRGRKRLFCQRHMSSGPAQRYRQEKKRRHRARV